MSTLTQRLAPVTIRLYSGVVETVYGVETAIDKKRIIESCYLSHLGLEGDECADKRFHGGLDRALHHYPAEHYSFWERVYGENKRPWKAPGMGENISTRGMTERTVCIGDKFQLGDAIVEVSQPRSPCFKLNICWKDENVSGLMQENSLCGWLYRVIQPGLVEHDAKLTLLEREPNAFSVKDACDVFFGSPLNKEKLSRLTEIKALSSSWTQKIFCRLETGEIEDWSWRLHGKT